MTEFNPIIDTCDQGHNFAKLPDHPKNSMGGPACPHCMSIGLERARTDLIKTNVFFLAAVGGNYSQLDYYFDARKAIENDQEAMTRLSTFAVFAEGPLREYLDEQSRLYMSRPQVLNDVLVGALPK